jgi:hypothetical protein
VNAAGRAGWVAIACFAAFVGVNAGAASPPGVAWQSLTSTQKQFLGPLEHDWSTLEPNRRQKWLEVAARFPSMSADERARVQERMAEWARLTPAQRTQARMQFQEVRQLPAQERNAKWQAYQALPEEERQKLALRAAPAAKLAAVDAYPVGKTSAGRSGLAASGAASGSNGRAVAPIVVQARPGATTTTMTAKAPAPRHVQAGAPKIAATATDVNPATLLPRRPSAVPVSAAAGASEPVAEQP